MADVLDEYLNVWNRKPALRAIYEDFYDRISALCTSGLTIEIGGGIGNLKGGCPMRCSLMFSLRHGSIVWPMLNTFRSATCGSVSRRDAVSGSRSL